VVFVPDRPRKPATVILHVAGRGKPRDLQTPSLPLELARKGFVVLSMDLRGLGETDVDPDSVPPAPTRFDVRQWRRDQLAINAATIGRTMTGMRAMDILRGLDWLEAQRQWKGSQVVLAGEGIGGLYALAAAALDDRPAGVICHGTLGACRWLVTSRHYNLLDYFWTPGMLEDFDIPDLVALCAPRPVLWLDGVNPQGERAGAAEEAEAMAYPREAYALLGAEEKFSSARTPDGRSDQVAGAAERFLEGPARR